MLVAKPFEVEDLNYINLDMDINEVESKEHIIELYKSLDEQSIFVTFLEDNKIVAISGIKHLYGDVGEIFNIRTKNLKAKHIKEMKRHLHGVAKLFDRVQAVSKPKWDRWHKALGFTKEATMRKFMHGKDYDLWVIIN